MKNLFPTLFVNHGGGPLPLLGQQNEIADQLRKAMQQLPSLPKKIVVVSAHWESDPIKISSGSNPPMLFDYHGFPPQTYEYMYDAPGSPELAKRIHELLQEKGLKCELDSRRGFDHGVFVPLMLMHPKADIPIVSVSLHASLDAETNMKIGEALQPLREENVLILGSGYTFHNMNAFFNPSNQSHAASKAFNGWLKDTILNDKSGEFAELKNWAKAPGARICHPREEHLLPLLVVAAAAPGSQAKVIFDTTSEEGDHAVTSYIFL